MIIQIVGYKNSGKTTLMTHAVSFLKEKGFTVATIKHHGHLGNDITLQNDDVDHMKHFNAGADQSIVQGETFQQTVTRISKQNLTDIIKESVTIDCNIILVEGFKEEPFKKVVVYRDDSDLEMLSKLTNVCFTINLNESNVYEKFEIALLELIKIEGLKS